MNDSQEAISRQTGKTPQQCEHARVVALRRLAVAVVLAAIAAGLLIAA